MTRPASIVNAPYPFPNESAASWIHRVCQLHGVTYKVLTRVLSLSACRDPDVAEPRDFLCRIGVGTGVSAKRLQALADVFHAVRLHPPSKSLLNFHKRTPSYRFCPECLTTDLVPYLRIGWRFKDWTVCPDHHVRMLEHCQSCGAPVLGTKPCLGLSGENALGVGHCALCENPLATTTESYQQVWVSPAKLKAQEAVVSAVRTGAFRIEGDDRHLSLDFLLWLRDNRWMLKSFLDGHRRDPKPTRVKYAVSDLIDAYSLERLSKRTATELLYRRMVRDKKRWSTWADRCYEEIVRRQRL